MFTLRINAYKSWMKRFKVLRCNHVMLLVQLGINSTRDVWKFCQIGLAPAARPILAKFANITRTINP